MNRRATFREADVSRALKGARKAGLKVARIEIDCDGKIAVIAGAPVPGDGQKEGNEWDEVLTNEAAPAT
jgi:hypothetical protein